MVEYDLALYGSEGMTLRLAADVVESLNTSLISIDLQAGFPLDPTFVSVNAGGQVDASLLSSECSGFVNTQPVVTVHWAGKAPFVKAFFVSDDDPTMIVGTPDGQITVQRRRERPAARPADPNRQPDHWHLQDLARQLFAQPADPWCARAHHQGRRYPQHLRPGQLHPAPASAGGCTPSRLRSPARPSPRHGGQDGGSTRADG